MLKFTFTTATRAIDISLLERLLARERSRDPKSTSTQHYEKCVSDTKAVTESDQFKDLESTLNAINPLLERAGKLAKELEMNFAVENEDGETVISFNHVTGFESSEWGSSSSNC